MADLNKAINVFTKTLLWKLTEGHPVEQEEIDALNEMRSEAGMKPLAIQVTGTPASGQPAAPRKPEPQQPPQPQWKQKRPRQEKTEESENFQPRPLVVNGQPVDGMLLPEGKLWTNRFYVKSESSGNLYTISQNKAGRYWGCSCPGWIGHRNCKHLKALGLPGHERPFEATLKAASAKRASVKFADDSYPEAAHILAAEIIHSDTELSQMMEPAVPAVLGEAHIDGPEAGPSNDELHENTHEENGVPVTDGDLKSPERQNTNAMREALETQVEMEVGKPIEQKQQEVAMQEKVQDEALAQGAGGLAGGAAKEVSAKPGTQIIINVASKKTASFMVVMEKNTSNAQRFATAEEAESAAHELQSRWSGMPSDWRVEPSTDPVNYRFDAEQYRSVPVEKAASKRAADDEITRPGGPLKKGEHIQIKPEWQDPGDDKYEWMVVRDEAGGSVGIMAIPKDKAEHERWNQTPPGLRAWSTAQSRMVDRFGEKSSAAGETKACKQCGSSMPKDAPDTCAMCVTHGGPEVRGQVPEHMKHKGSKTAQDYPNNPTEDYEDRVRAYEEQGMDRSDAQSVVDAEIAKEHPKARYRLYTGPTIVKQTADLLRKAGIRVTVEGTEHVHFESDIRDPQEMTLKLRDILGAQWGVKGVQRLGAEGIGGEDDSKITSGQGGGMFGGTDLEGPSFHVGFTFRGTEREASFSTFKEAHAFLKSASAKFGKVAGDWTMKCPHCKQAASKASREDSYVCKTCGWNSHTSVAETTPPRKSKRAASPSATILPAQSTQPSGSYAYEDISEEALPIAQPVEPGHAMAAAEGITPAAAKKIVADELTKRGMPFERLRAKTIGFSDLARGSKLFVMIYGAKADPQYKEIGDIARQNGFLIEVHGPGIVGSQQKEAAADPAKRNLVLTLLKGGRALTTGEIEKALGGGKYTNNAYPVLQELAGDGLVQHRKMRWSLKASAKTAEWKGWTEDMPVQVVGDRSYEKFPNLAAAKQKYPTLDPGHNTNDFTWAMRGEIDGVPAIRFETWPANKMYSASAKKKSYRVGKLAFSLETRVSENNKTDVFKAVVDRLNEIHADLKRKNPQGFMDSFEQQLPSRMMDIAQALGLQVDYMPESDTYMLYDEAAAGTKNTGYGELLEKEQNRKEPASGLRDTMEREKSRDNSKLPAPVGSLKAAGIRVTSAKPLPRKGTPEFARVQIAIQTLKMPDAIADVMGGPGREDSLKTLAEYGMRWDDKDYMNGGKGLKKAGDGMAKTENELEKEAGFNFFFPGQVLKEFYPEIQHEIVDYPNANNQPMGQSTPEIVGDGGHELEGVLDDALDTSVVEMIQLPADVGGIEEFAMAAADYSSTSPAGGMGIGRDGKPEVLEGAPLRKENDIRGYMFTDEFYGQYDGIPGAAMAVASKTAAEGDETKQFSLFLKKVCGEIAATLVAAFKVTTRPLLDKVPGMGEIQLDIIEQGVGAMLPPGQTTQGGRVKWLMDKLNDGDIKSAINEAWAQAAVWNDNPEGGFVYEVFVRPETIDTDSLVMKYKFVCGTRE